MNNMKYFVDKYLNGTESVLDVGSMDVNGSYRGMFKYYQGLDIAPGKNVDIHAKEPYSWPIDDDTFDAVISGQAFEHIEFPEKTMAEIGRVLKPGGYCGIIAPSAGPVHNYPNDYRRYNAYTIAQLADAGGLYVVEVLTSNEGPWKDAVLIARKPKAKKKK